MNAHSVLGTRNMCEAMRRLMQDEIAHEVREAEMNGKKEMALSLAGMGMPAEKIAEAAKVSLKVVQGWLAGSMSLAK